MPARTARSVRVSFIIAIALAALAAAPLLAQEAKLSELAAAPVHSGENLLPDPGFEEDGPGGIPRGWSWDRGRTDATCRADEEAAHGGKRCLLFASGTPFGAHIFGSLWTSAPVRIEPGKTYTLSAWVLSEDPGAAWIGGGAGWQLRIHVPRTSKRWRLVSTTYTAAADETGFTFRINIDSVTPGLRVDDVKLEAGETATPSWDGGERFRIEPRSDEASTHGDGPFRIEFDLAAPRAVERAVLEGSLPGAAAPVRQELALAKGLNRVEVRGSSEGLDDSLRPAALRLFLDGSEAARGESSARFLSPVATKRRLDAIRSGIDSRRSGLEELRAAGQDISDPLVSLTVEENFVPWIDEDLRRGETARAADQLRELEAVDARLRRRIDEARAGARLPESPRWTGARRARVEGPSFIGPAAFPARPGDILERPIFFVGYGAFGQVRADIEKLPSYGCNIVQVEFGPSAVFPADGPPSSAPMDDFRRLLDRAAAAGVAVNLLISPHYFPGWMLDKYPALRKKREGFLGYCLHAPEGQDLLRRFIDAAIPPLKDHRALHSICLSNEPVNLEEPCEPGRQLWHEWLRKRHGDAAAMNAKWGTKFAAIEDAPMPDPFGTPGAMEALPQALRVDFGLFNREFFAGWHARMAEEIRRLAPGLPIHAKPMTWTFVNDGDARFGVDAELFGAFSDINGNDSVCFYDHEGGEFAQGWGLNALGHDLQRSVRDGPVFNSENHIIVDRETRPVPPEHIRAALWQASVHGQSATTIWVWERSYDPKSDCAGSILHRPACVEEAGRTGLDLNRLAVEVTALQRLEPQAAILFSASGLIGEGAPYTDCGGKVHAALSFTGLKIGFVTERQLASGVVPKASLLFVPNLHRLPEAAFRTLKTYPGKIVLAGDGPLLGSDEYGRPRAERIEGEAIAYRYGKTGWRDLWTEIGQKLPAWGVRPEVEVLGPAGEPVWGIEWLAAPAAGGGLDVNLCNFRGKPVEVRLARGGKPAAGRDLLDGSARGPELKLAPLEIRLIHLDR